LTFRQFRHRKLNYVRSETRRRSNSKDADSPIEAGSLNLDRIAPYCTEAATYRKLCSRRSRCGRRVLSIDCHVQRLPSPMHPSRFRPLDTGGQFWRPLPSAVTSLAVRRTVGIQRKNHASPHREPLRNDTYSYEPQWSNYESSSVLRHCHKGACVTVYNRVFRVKHPQISKLHISHPQMGLPYTRTRF